MKKEYTDNLNLINMSLKEELSTLKKHRNNLEKQLYLIKNARAYKFWQNLNYLKNRNRNFRAMSFLNKFTFLNKKVSAFKNQKKYIKKINKINNLKKYKISIIIPTYNAESFLKPLLRSILAQRHMDDLEIIIIDSESQDKTRQIAKKFGAKVLTIKQKDFNHGLVRNIGAKEAKHELLLFTVQDALPKNNILFAQMAELLQKETKIAAVTTIQNPRPDADLFARWQIDNHNEFLKLNYNSISFVKDFTSFKKEPFIIKRRVSLLDNVCSLYKKTIFIKQLGFKKISFGEDLDYALRALKANYSLGLLSSNGVIHSHNRPAHYFLKRTFLSTIVESKILANTNKINEENLIKELMIAIVLADFFHYTNQRPFHRNLLDLKKISNKYLSSNFKIEPNQALTKDFYIIFKKLSNNKIQITITEILNYYLNLFHILDNYLIKHKTQIIEESDGKQFLEKILATKLGINLANYYLDKKNSKVTQNKKFILEFLSGGV